jgi:SAM-dependent methyltransferase
VITWEERLTHESKPHTRVEHDLRYGLAAPLVASGVLWAELGCGNGIAAADALQGSFAGRAVLVDQSGAALDRAREALRIADMRALVADLATTDGVAAAREAILDGAPAGPRTVTCFEVVEHLESFVPVMELLFELAGEHDFTTLLSVPNDAFWAIQNPYHQTMWGEGAFEELRRLLPAGHVLLRQVPLVGSAAVAEDTTLPLADVTVAAERVPSHYLAAFGPRAGEVAPRALALAADLDEQRRWERQRENDIAVMQHTLEGFRPTFAYRDRLEAELEQARARIAELEAQDQ